jgi:hypothetical protein
VVSEVHSLRHEIVYRFGWNDICCIKESAEVFPFYDYSPRFFDYFNLSNQSGSTSHVKSTFLEQRLDNYMFRTRLIEAFENQYVMIQIKGKSLFGFL